MSPPPPREPSALRVVRGYEHAYPAIDQRQAYDRAGDLGDHLQTSLVAERHGVDMAPGHATPAGVALHRQPEWDAGDGVFREAHGVPLYGRVPAPDPHGIATVDGDRVLVWGLPPITAGGREQSTCEDGAAHSVVYPTPSRKGLFRGQAEGAEVARRIRDAVPCGVDEHADAGVLPPGPAKAGGPHRRYDQVLAGPVEPVILPEPEPLVLPDDAGVIAVG